MKTALMTLLSGVALAITFFLAQSVLAGDGDADARKTLLGTWKGAVDNGATGHELTITAELISGMKDGKRSLGAGSFTLDRSKKPWHLDATRTEGGKKGQVYQGIYSLEGDTLKWCVSTGSDRPTEFATGGSNFMLVLKRAKD